MPEGIKEKCFQKIDLKLGIKKNASRQSRLGMDCVTSWNFEIINYLILK